MDMFFLFKSQVPCDEEARLVFASSPYLCGCSPPHQLTPGIGQAWTLQAHGTKSTWP